MSSLTLLSITPQVQPMCTVSTTRWFVATNRSFGYYKAEGGPLYYKVLWDHIQYVSQTSNKKEFKVIYFIVLTLLNSCSQVLPLALSLSP
jgi:hypothetical protein